jgi:putative transposase
MPRKNLILTNEYYYHVTTRSNHKEWFALPLNKVWSISVLAFKKAQKHHPAIVSQYVLMSNHYHLLIRTPNCDIDHFMFWFNKTFSDELRRRTNSENRMFGSNYKWSLITNDIYFKNVFRYIYQNPIRAGVVTNCESYPYSTFHYTYYQKIIPFRFQVLEHLEFRNPLLNHLYDSERAGAIRSGLKKSQFKMKRAS